MGAENPNIAEELELYLDSQTHFIEKITHVPLDLERSQEIIRFLKNQVKTESATSMKTSWICNGLLYRCELTVDKIQEMVNTQEVSVTFNGLLGDAANKLRNENNMSNLFKEVLNLAEDDMQVRFAQAVCREFSDIADSADDLTVYPDWPPNLYQKERQRQNPETEPFGLPHGPAQNWTAIKSPYSTPVLWVPNHQ